MDEQDETATLRFRAQADGRKVARLPGGKVVLVDLDHIEDVADGEWWLVRLRHRETFAIAQPIERVTEPQPRPGMDASPASGAASAASAPAAVPPPPEDARTTIPVTHAPPAATAATATAATATAATATAAVTGAKRPPARQLPTPLAVGGMLIEPDNIIRPGDRVALFVDGANMDHACREAGYFVDYRKARDYFVAAGTYYAGFYYVADATAMDPIQTRFLDFLSHAGFIVRRKPIKVITDSETGERVYKGNLDTEIVLDMLNTVGNYDVAFLFSGDSDFERAVDLLRSRGKRVYVVTSFKTLSRELAYVADKPIFRIEDFKSILARDEVRG